MVLKDSTRFDSQLPFHSGDIIGSIVAFTEYIVFVVGKHDIHALGIYSFLLSKTSAAHTRGSKSHIADKDLSQTRPSAITNDYYLHNHEHVNAILAY